MLCGAVQADRLAASISQALADAGIGEGRTVKPSDMLRFGMGLGITLGANGLLKDLGCGKVRKFVGKYFSLAKV